MEKKEWKYCVAGNIVKTHIDDNGILRCGSSVFAGGTKVYLCKGTPWDDMSSGIMIIGLNRLKKYQATGVPVKLIENVRFQNSI